MNRFGMVLMLPLLALDCLGNLLLCQSWRNTMSSEAWHHRAHEYWWWCHLAIDTLFFWQPEHCRNQAEREERFGSVWAAWLHDFRGTAQKTIAEEGLG